VTSAETLGRRIGSFSAVLWDMDGTLVDTEPSWISAEMALARRHGATWSAEQALELVGSDLLDSGRHIRTHMGIEMSPEQIVEELLDSVIEQVSRSVPWRAGARELLFALRDSGVPCALVTMSYARLVDPILSALPDDTFTAVVTGDAVDHGKPHPEPYLAAARRLDVLASESLAIEDSATGATSAASAGCTVLCVPLHVTIPPGPGRVFAESLVGLDPTTVLRMPEDRGLASNRIM
jgi:HAD superfamily hydrolase (TIGR01509 family)